MDRPAILRAGRAARLPDGQLGTIFGLIVTFLIFGLLTMRAVPFNVSAVSMRGVDMMPFNVMLLPVMIMGSSSWGCWRPPWRPSCARRIPFTPSRTAGS